MPIIAIRSWIKSLQFTGKLGFQTWTDIQTYRSQKFQLLDWIGLGANSVKIFFFFLSWTPWSKRVRGYHLSIIIASLRWKYASNKRRERKLKKTKQIKTQFVKECFRRKKLSLSTKEDKLYFCLLYYTLYFFIFFCNLDIIESFNIHLYCIFCSTSLSAIKFIILIFQQHDIKQVNHDHQRMMVDSIEMIV